MISRLTYHNYIQFFIPDKTETELKVFRSNKFQKKRPDSSHIMNKNHNVICHYLFGNQTTGPASFIFFFSPEKSIVYFHKWSIFCLGTSSQFPERVWEYSFLSCCISLHSISRSEESSRLCKNTHLSKLHKYMYLRNNKQCSDCWI